MGKINFIPSSNGKVIGNHAALEQPVNPTDLADYLEATNRPAFNAPSITNEVFVETTGSDATGDGLSVGTAFATVSKAIQMIGTLNDSTVTIRLGSGTFTMPDLLSEQNWTTFLGTTSVSESRTISTVDTLSDADGIALTIDGGPFVTDALRGQLIQWTSGAANNDFGWIYRNTGNQIFVTNEDPTSLPAIVATNTLDFITLDTTLEYTGTPVIQNSVQFNVQKCNVADDAANGRVLFVLSTDKVEYRYCNWTMARPQVGGYGRAHFWCNYIGTKGATNRGCLAGVNGSFIQLERGTVIDCGLNTSAANKRFIQFAAGANVSYTGQIVVRQIDDAKGVQCDGVEWIAAGGLGAHDTWRFETEGVTASCIAGFVVNTTGEGLGGNLQLPNLHGEVTSAYAITAENNAYVVLGDTSNLLTTGNANAVSADNGVSDTAQGVGSDSTEIFGGNPVNGRVNQPLTAGSILLPNSRIKSTSGSGGPVTLISTPSISDGVDGQRMLIIGTSDTNTITFQDEDVLAGSNLSFQNFDNCTLGQGDTLEMVWTNVTSNWQEVSRSQKEFDPANHFTVASSVTQGIESAGTYQDISFSDNDIIDGWTHATYTASTISFTATDTIGDTANGLGDFKVGESIRISGSASNDGLYEIATVSAGTITTVETIATEAAGASVTIAGSILVCPRTGLYSFSAVVYSQKGGGSTSLLEFVMNLNGSPASRVYVQELVTNGEIKSLTLVGDFPVTKSDELSITMTANTTNTEIFAPTTTGANPFSIIFSGFQIPGSK